MKNQWMALLIAMLAVSTPAICQDQKAGGPCEGCEAVYENPIPTEKLGSFLRMPDTSWEGKKPLGINGVVYKADGKTPAPDVILYIYHTDQTGHYPTKGDEKGWGKRHGYLRGWMRTNQKGEYKFVTLRPAAYPGRNEPAHIHLIVKEPGVNAYYLDDYLFSDDSLLTPEKRRNLPNRGGSGILVLKDVGNMFKAERNLYLGKNIPHYPANQ